MAILNYTTKIDSFKTIGEITKCLVSHGASKIVTDYQGMVPSAITFSLMIGDKPVYYSLPANYSGVLRAMELNKVSKSFCNQEQAVRVSWRIIKDWVEAQMAIVEAQLADVSEVFLPYAIMATGNTLYQDIQLGNQLKLK
jgi:hypothetical protein